MTLRRDGNTTPRNAASRKSPRRAKSRAALPRKTEFTGHDRFLWLRQRAFESIAEARKRIRNGPESKSGLDLYTAAEVATARDFLRDLSNEARNSGKSRGGSPTEAENQKMLRVFFLLSTGKSLKSRAPTGRDPERFARSLSVQKKRFSERVRAEFCFRFGLDEKSQVPAGFLQHKMAWRPLLGCFGNIARWPGVDSNCCQHGYALCEALRRSKVPKIKVPEVTAASTKRSFRATPVTVLTSQHSPLRPRNFYDSRHR